MPNGVNKLSVTVRGLVPPPNPGISTAAHGGSPGFTHAAGAFDGLPKDVFLWLSGGASAHAHGIEAEAKGTEPHAAHVPRGRGGEQVQLHRRPQPLGSM